MLGETLPRWRVKAFLYLALTIRIIRRVTTIRATIRLLYNKFSNRLYMGCYKYENGS